MSKYVKKASLGSPELNYFQNSFIDFTQFCVHKNGLDFREHHPFHKPLDAICLLSFQATCRNQLECIQLNLMQFPIRSHKLQWNNPLPSPMLIEMLSYNILYSCCQATLPVRMYGRSQLSQTLGQHSLGGPVPHFSRSLKSTPMPNAILSLSIEWSCCHNHDPWKNASSILLHIDLSHHLNAFQGNYRPGMGRGWGTFKVFRIVPSVSLAARRWFLSEAAAQTCPNLYYNSIRIDQLAKTARQSNSHVHHPMSVSVDVLGSIISAKNSTCPSFDEMPVDSQNLRFLQQELFDW